MPRKDEGRARHPATATKANRPFKNSSSRRHNLELCTCSSTGWCWVCADRRQEQYENRRPNWDIARAAARASIRDENQQRGRSKSHERRAAHQLVILWSSE